MYENLPTILSSILTIINSHENKETVTHDFLQVCRQATVLTLIENLPQEKQQELKQRIAAITSGELGKQIILSYFSDEEYQKTLDEASRKLFQEYIADILSTVSQTTKETLKNYLKEVAPNVI
jgi:uncharacterized membrane-anchored protein YjiN (DUF445 family)